MELLGGSVRIVAEDTLSQHFVVVGMTRCKRLLLVAREACLRDSGPLEISWILSRMTVLTFCLRRMCSVNFPIWRNRCVSRRGNKELDLVKCVTVLPDQLVLSKRDPNRKSLASGLCLSLFEGIAIQQNFSSARDNLNRFSFKNGLVGWTQNTGLFGLLGNSEVDRLSQNN